MANQKQMAKAAAKQAAQQEQQKQQRKQKMNTIAAIAALILILCGAFVLGGKNDAATPDNSASPSGPSAIAEMTEKATHQAVIEIKDYGVITAELYGEAAPITVANFVKLANENFYDGLTFHRVFSGFMIQGGDPKGNGTGGSDENIKGEFSVNGVNNPILHKRGVLSMARSSANDSASSQFFIMHDAAPHLDGSYAAFGCVVTGMEIVDAICKNTPVTDSNGSVAKGNQPVITSIRVTEIAK